MSNTTNHSYIIIQLLHEFNHLSIASGFGADIPNGFSALNLLSSATFLKATADCANVQTGQQHAAIISTIHGSSGNPIKFLVFARLQAIIQHGPARKKAGIHKPPQSFLSSI